MANMEKIIRPHLPPNVAPTNTISTCQVPPENTVVQFGQSNSAQATTSTATLSFDYSNSAKWYMTKQEREFEFGEIFKTR
jgi:hypothetical protein